MPRFFTSFKNDRQVFTVVLQETILSFLLQLAPSVNLSVDTFPVSGDGLHFVFFSLSSNRRGRLKFPILSFCNKHVGTAFCMNHFHILFFYIKLQILSSLVVSFPCTRREVPSLRGDRGMFAYTSQNTFYWFYSYLLFFLCVCSHLFLFLRFCSHLPLSSANADTFPVSGDSLRSLYFAF